MNQHRSAGGRAPAGDPPPEVDEADALEQRLPPTGEDEVDDVTGDVPAGVDEADALDQLREVDLGDDGYDVP